MSVHHWSATILCLLSLTAGARCQETQGLPADVAALRAGVRQLPKTGVPGGLVVFGQAAQVVATAADGKVVRPVVAIARQGQGRVLALGHGGLLGRDGEDLAAFHRNAARWLFGLAPDEGGRGRRMILLGRNAPGLQGAVEDLGAEVVRDGLRDARKGDLLVLFDNRALPPAEVARVHKLVAAGAGLVVCGPGWGWRQLNPTGELRADHGGNQVAMSLGIAIADGTVGRPEPSDADGPARLRDAHAGQVLALLKAKGGDALNPQRTATLEHALRNLATDHPLVQELLGFCRQQDAMRAPSEQDPVTREQPLRRLAVVAAHITGEPLAGSPEDFPGAPAAGAKAKDVELAVDPTVPGWHGTGRYAAPGGVVSVRIPPGAVDAGLRIRIGCHKDLLWDKDEWRRHPEITVEVPVTGPVTEVSNPFGGLVYVVVPERRGRASGTQPAIPVKISGAVPAPRFVLGKTTIREWYRLRQAPGPWAELEAWKVIVTVPSEFVRDLSDPVPLLQHWNQVLEMYAELGQRPLRTRLERLVSDRQISLGYMHSGYPIMTHLDAAPRMVDLKHLTTKGDWGFWHELGHNHQRPEWTFRGTTEVTCNLFSLYVWEQVLGVSPAEHPRVRGQRPKVASYLAQGAPFTRWQKEPFLALAMYAQLQEEFGWEAFQEVFAEYEQLPDEARPKGDAAKRDQWMARFSRNVGRNLGPFFQKWGIPVSDAALASVAQLPEWMPKRWR